MSEQKAGRVLVADDNEINQRVIRGMLEHVGYEVNAVQHGGEVLEALEADGYDLVIMDCMMPVMDGYQATRAIRASKSASFDPHIPVLAITALAAPGDREKCLAAGMDDYISKPVVAGPLFQKVGQLIGTRTAAPEPSADESMPDKSMPDEPIPDMLAALSGRLLEDATNWQDELDWLQEAEAFQELGRLAHKIRGSADIFSAKALSQASATLESAMRKGEFAAAAALTDTLRHELARLESRLRNRA